MVNGEVSHDRVSRFLAQRDYTSRDLWLQVKSTVRQVEDAEGVLIFDDTIQEKALTDESDLMYRHDAIHKDFSCIKAYQEATGINVQMTAWQAPG